MAIGEKQFVPRVPLSSPLFSRSFLVFFFGFRAPARPDRSIEQNARGESEPDDEGQSLGDAEGEDHD